MLFSLRHIVDETLQDGTTSLTPIPAPKLSAPTLLVKGTYTTSSFEAPTDLVVETRYLGADADQMRAELLGSSRTELGEGFTQFYATTYPGIQAIGLPEATDDRRANALTIVERYKIPNFWTKPRNAGRRPSVDLYPLVLMGVVPKPYASDRVMPVALSFPRRVKELTEVVLPEDWEISRARETIRDDAMQLDFEVSSANRRVVVSYDYQTLRDGIPASQLASHRLVRGRLLDRLGYAFGGSTGLLSGGLNWSAVILMGVLAPIAVAASVWLLRKRSINVRTPLDPASAGIAGRLIGVALLLVFGLLRHAYGLYETRWAWWLDQWLMRTSPDQDGYHPWWAPYLFIELLGNSLSLCFVLILLILFFAKRRTFPRILVWYLVFQGGYLLISAILARFLPEMTQNAFSFLLATAWVIGPLSAFVPYLFLSDRARSTFVR